ncbi:HAD-IIB family hydrolase [Paenibacillus endoradicis]|uniref:HAD-IIB family hydrolase n=1 Tax=Paenibacillus endoradicis TaxID=2972487 RepID=UPI0021594CF6|nr:HAD family hydrolase [Paenibacillus endoradicis]MCR8656438.1 Cof-type HAD-IIB family hydrolase [Paenibacillus endoradicis]
MNYIFDLDGTICFKGKPLTQHMVRALQQLEYIGHAIIFASARPIRDLLPILPESMHHFPMIGGNGAFVVPGELKISTTFFDPAITEALLQLIRKYNADYLIDSSWDYAYYARKEYAIRGNLDPQQRAVNKSLDSLEGLVKVVILHSEDNEEMLKELTKLPVVISKHGNEDIIDISPQGIDKWAGIQALGIAPYDYIAFGNDANDLSMFTFAKYSVCVGNHPQLGELANEVIVSDEEQVISKIVNISNNEVLNANE